MWTAWGMRCAEALDAQLDVPGQTEASLRCQRVAVGNHIHEDARLVPEPHRRDHVGIASCAQVAHQSLDVRHRVRLDHHVHVARALRRRHEHEEPGHERTNQAVPPLHGVQRPNQAHHRLLQVKVDVRHVVASSSRGMRRSAASAARSVPRYRSSA